MRENAKTMTLRLNAAEYAHLCQQAKAAGLKKEPFIRTLIMGVNLRPRPPDEYAEIRRQLAAIGNNINQIARAVNARGFAAKKGSRRDHEKTQHHPVCGGNCCDRSGAGDDLGHRGAALIWRTRKYSPSAQDWMTA